MKYEASPVAGEVSGAELGDRRLSRRFERVSEMMARDPGRSFPEACGENESALEATYRFLSNEGITPATLLESHYQATIERMAPAGQALIVHDTTEFVFKGDREGLGRVQRSGQGFMGHFALAVSAEGRREAMGVMGMLPIFRPRGRFAEHWRKRYHAADKESLRWGKLVEEIAGRLGDRIQAIHVMDREADSYELLAQLVEHRHRFVIRARTDLRKTAQGGQVADATQGVQTIALREVSLSERKARNKGTKTKKTRPLV
jgi:hypothetical protein